MGLSRNVINYFKRIGRIKNFEKTYFSKKIPVLKNTVAAVETAENPLVSIVIFGDGDLQNSLSALQQAIPNGVNCEFFVLRDHQNINGIQWISDSNQSFTANLNQAIKKAKGEYIYLLPNGGMVEKNALEELLSVFKNFTDTGAVCSKWIDSNRNLIHSGGFVLKGGAFHTAPENTKAFYPEVNYIVKTDFCAGDLLFKKKSDEGILRQFDEQFEVTDGWETDFCFNLKHTEGKSCYYMPFSEIISTPFTAPKNTQAFLHKWKDQISEIAAVEIAERIAGIYQNRAVVFFCDTIPEHDRDSGSNRLKEIITAFIEMEFRVLLISKYTYNDNKYIGFYERLGANVFYEHQKYIGFESFLTKQQTAAAVAWFYGPRVFMKYYKAAQKLLPNAKLIYDMVDIHHLRYERAIALDPKRISNRKRFRVYKKMEFQAAALADFVITISDFEENYMKSVCDNHKIITISNIHYPKIDKKNTLPFELRSGIVFIGSTHTPNIDALYYLYNEIMPIVWKALPGLKVNIIGTVDQIVTDISHPDFIFHGYVPTVDELFVSNRLMIAPLRYGAGVKGKIGQAFEYYLPVVTTSIGAEGMKLVNEKNALIEDETQQFAGAIVRLYTDAALWHHLQENSENSLEPFSTATLKKTLNTFIQ